VLTKHEQDGQLMQGIVLELLSDIPIRAEWICIAKREGLVMIPVHARRMGEEKEALVLQEMRKAQVFMHPRGRRSIGDEWCKYKNEQICEQAVHRRVLFSQKLSSRIPKGNIKKPSTEASGKMHQRLGGILHSGYQAVAEVWKRVSISRDGGYKWIAMTKHG
jgi:hypothetical protein